MARFWSSTTCSASTTATSRSSSSASPRSAGSPSRESAPTPRRSAPGRSRTRSSTRTRSRRRSSRSSRATSRRRRWSAPILPGTGESDPEELLLLRVEVVGADHALVAELRQLLELGGVVALARRLRLLRRLLLVGLVLGGPPLLLAVLAPAGHPRGHTDASRASQQSRSLS